MLSPLLMLPLSFHLTIQVLLFAMARRIAVEICSHAMDFQ
jgi:hypothetical protein